DLRCGGFDGTTIAAMGRRRIERSTDVYLTDRRVTQKADHAIVTVYGLCLYDTGIVDNGLANRIGTLGAQEHPAAIGLNQLIVFGQSVHGTLVDRIGQQRPVVELETDLV